MFQERPRKSDLRSCFATEAEEAKKIELRRTITDFRWLRRYIEVPSRGPPIAQIPQNLLVCRFEPVGFQADNADGILTLQRFAASLYGLGGITKLERGQEA
jgi:hypothetical protein